MTKIAVVSCAFGFTPDSLYEPIFNNCNYYFFTDRDFKSSHWKIKKLYPNSLDVKYRNRRCGKFPKVLTNYFLPNYDYYIWHDFTHKLVVDPEILISKFLDNSDMAFFKHPHRDSWHTELEEVLNSGLDHSFLLENQKKYYESENIEKNKNFYECTCFIRKNNDLANNVFSFWYEHISMFSSRDQVSLPAAIQKYNPKVSIMDGTCQIYHGGNEYIKQIHHSLRLQRLVP